MQPFEQLQIDIETIQNKLIKQIDELIASGTSKKDITKFINSIDFNEMLLDLGADKAINKYSNSLDKVVGGFGTDIPTELLDDIELLQDINLDYILGSMNNKMNIWKSTMIEGLISGVKDKDIINQLKTIGLTDAQSGAVIQTSYYNFSRATTATIFRDNPEQRFRYAGGTIPTSSDQCRYLYENQRQEGYTKAEIDKGIVTPYGIINWFGRSPNWNCGHEWTTI